MVKEVKHWLKDEGLSPHIKLTRTSCMGYCNAEGGVMLSFPNGNVYQGLQTVEELKALIRKEISASQL